MSEAPTTPTSTPTPSASTPAAAEAGAAPAAAAPSLADALGLSPDANGEPTGEPASPPAPDAGEGASAESEGGPVEGSPDPAPHTDGMTPPEAYEFTFPEGFTADEALQTDARALFSELGVPKDKAQGLIDLWVKAQTAQHTAATEAFEASQAANLETINSMPEFQGPTREKSLQAIGKVLDEYGADAKAGILSNPAVGNDPALTRFILNMAHALSEGEPASPGRPAPNGRDGKSLANRTLGERLGFTDTPQ